MRRLLVISVVWLATAGVAFGISMEFLVKPDGLDQGKYLFSVMAKNDRDGIVFHITVTAKKEAEDIPADTIAGVGMVTREPTQRSVGLLQPALPVNLKKTARQWTADFTLSHEFLKKPGLCFLFTEKAHATIDGKIVAMPAADFYEAELKEFLPK